MAQLKYNLTYKFSQDHLDLLFSCLRSRGGHINPNVKQFQWALRKLDMTFHTVMSFAEAEETVDLNSVSVYEEPIKNVKCLLENKNSYYKDCLLYTSRCV